MEQISQGKILTHLDRINHSKKPITADIFLTHYCNNKCPYCSYNRWNLEKKNQYMSYPDFVTYTQRLRKLGILGIILTGGGEPTINPDFDKITLHLEANDFTYGINTNFNKLRFFKPDFLKVSLDAWSEDSYEELRGVRSYNQTRENIKQYSEWKKKNSPFTLLGIQAIGTSIENINKFYQANKDLDVDYISIRPMESTNGEYYKQLPTSQDSPAEILNFLKELQNIDKRISINYKWEMLDTQEKTCTANWAQLAIDINGNVLYCCQKPYQVVGNIMDSDILEKKQKATTDMKMCDIPCRLTAPNHEVENFTLDRIKDLNCTVKKCFI